MTSLEHDCKVKGTVEYDIVTHIIDTGIFINLRRKLCRLAMVNKNHPLTQRYFKSTAARRREEARHLVNYLNMIHPFSMSNLYWEFFMFWVYIHLFVICSVSVAFLNDETILNKMNMYRFVFDYMQVMDMIRLFFVGYYSTEKNRTIMRPIEVAKRYLSTYFFVDFLSTVPSHVELLRWTVLDKQTSVVLRSVRIFSLLKLFRMSRWLNALELFRQYMGYSSYWFKAIRSVLMYLMLILMLFAALFWITIAGFGNTTGLTRIQRFYRGLLVFLVVTHGEKVLGNVEFMLLFFVFLILGYVMQLFLFAQVMQIWNKFASSNNKNENILQQFQEYMKYRGLPQEIRNRIFAYFNFKFQNEFFNEAQINSIVSDNLKQEILWHLTKNHLGKARIFKGVPEKVLVKIASRLKSEIFLSDDVIVTADTPGTCMYFLYFGTVAVYTSSGKEICHLEDGAHFGAVSLVFDLPRIATVVAITPCELFKLKRSDYMNVIELFAESKAQIASNAREKLLDSRVEIF